MQVDPTLQPITTVFHHNIFDKFCVFDDLLCSQYNEFGFGFKVYIIVCKVYVALFAWDKVYIDGSRAVVVWVLAIVFSPLPGFKPRSKYMKQMDHHWTTELLFIYKMHFLSRKF